VHKDWLMEQVTLLGIVTPFQNWMVVSLTLVLISVLINRGEKY
jgi:hypothetical protein